jgi:hypothetical protein
VATPEVLQLHEDLSRRGWVGHLPVIMITMEQIHLDGVPRNWTQVLALN